MCPRHRRGAAMNRADVAWLAALAVLFLAWHVPLMDRTPAGQDEDWYGVPGITIVRTGLPRVPYITRTTRLGLLPGGRSAVYAPAAGLLPSGDRPPRARAGPRPGPAGLGAGGPRGRVAGLRPGPALARRPPGGEARGVGFRPVEALPLPGHDGPARHGGDPPRPRGGLARRRATARPRGGGRRRSRAVAAGLSMLAHPFGVVPATQVGLRLLTVPGRAPARRLAEAGRLRCGGPRRLRPLAPADCAPPRPLPGPVPGQRLPARGARVGAATSRAPLRLGLPARAVLGLAGPPQALLFGIALAWAPPPAPHGAGTRDLRFHLAASVVLLLLFQGRHPTLGYFAYPVALASVSVGGLAGLAASRLERSSPGYPGPECRAGDGPRPPRPPGRAPARRRPAGPGRRPAPPARRGVRRPRPRPHRHRRHPPGATTAVDAAYALDFYLAGRPALVAFIEPDPGLVLYDVRDRPFEYVVLGPVGLRLYRARMT